MNTRDASQIVRQGSAAPSDHGDAEPRQTRRSVLAALEWAPSHVLRAIGHTEEQAWSAIQIGLGRWTTLEEIETAAAEIVTEVERARGTRAGGGGS